MKTTIKHYNELSLDEFHDIIALRIAVFVVEQDCPYQELDGKDKEAFHVMVEKQSVILGTTRILPPGVAYDEPAIGRVVSDPESRHLKIGHILMKASMEFLEKTYGSRLARLSAQTHLVKFYAKHGFVSTGKTYLEDGIPHTEMLFQEKE